MKEINSIDDLKSISDIWKHTLVRPETPEDFNFFWEEWPLANGQKVSEQQINATESELNTLNTFTPDKKNIFCLLKTFDPTEKFLSYMYAMLIKNACNFIGNEQHDPTWENPNIWMFNECTPWDLLEFTVSPGCLDGLGFQPFDIYNSSLALTAVTLFKISKADIVIMEANGVVENPGFSNLLTVADMLGKSIVKFKDDGRNRWSGIGDPFTTLMYTGSGPNGTGAFQFSPKTPPQSSSPSTSLFESLPSSCTGRNSFIDQLKAAKINTSGGNCSNNLPKRINNLILLGQKLDSITDTISNIQTGSSKPNIGKWKIPPDYEPFTNLSNQFKINGIINYLPNSNVILFKNPDENYELKSYQSSQFSSSPQYTDKWNKIYLQHSFINIVFQQNQDLLPPACQSNTPCFNNTDCTNISPHLKCGSSGSCKNICVCASGPPCSSDSDCKASGKTTCDPTSGCCFGSQQIDELKNNNSLAEKFDYVISQLI